MVSHTSLAHRRGTTTLTVAGPDGTPLPHRDVVVAQRDHAFRFGCTGFDADRTFAAQWLGLFNTATLPFYWGQFEPVRGLPETARLRAAAEWFAGRGVQVKGHPLAWHTETAPWLDELTTAEVLPAQLARIDREVREFAGLIGAWDVINEVVIMPIFDRYPNGLTRACRALGRIPLVRHVFEAARAADPTATLLLNDFDLSAAYECLIEGLLEAGVRIDALGLQSHMHQGYWGEERTLATIERFARYGLPLHFTETTLVSGALMPAHIEDLNDYKVPAWPSTPEGESRQADELERHYRTLFGHPSVQAVTYWGLPDGGWLNAPSGLLRADGSPKPAYEALHSLVRGEWWLPPTRMTTNARGELTVTAFHGDYDLTVEDRVVQFSIT
ncbi:endo-1,4-beta-xylanase [Dactylosporangium sp. NPDC049140]|uniref:endo-1,4-beta-xylanase n=1 Tax=Dactylosporangium sp. NPDC049140 TaxID=3155647 RepID=UPI0033F8E972